MTNRSSQTLAGRAGRALRLSLRHRGELTRSLVLLPRVARSLRIRGYRPTARWLAQRRPPTPGTVGSGDRLPTDQLTTATDLAFIVRQTARLAPDATCLRRALVLDDLLARRGIPTTIRLGVRRAEGNQELSFHAWVEVDGRPVDESPAVVAAYTILDDEPSPPDRSAVDGAPGEAPPGDQPTGR